MAIGILKHRPSHCHTDIITQTITPPASSTSRQLQQQSGYLCLSCQLATMECNNEDRRNDRRNDNNKDQDDSDEESEILEESPCGRWLKRREEVSASTLRRRVTPPLVVGWGVFVKQNELIAMS